MGKGTLFHKGFYLVSPSILLRTTVFMQIKCKIQLTQGNSHSGTFLNVVTDNILSENRAKVNIFLACVLLTQYA